MKRILALLLVIGVFSGCLVRTYTIQKPRRDLDIKGNQGYLMGTPKESPTPSKTTRTFTVFEIELGPHQPKETSIPSISKKEEPASAPESTSFEETILEEEVIEQKPQENEQESKLAIPQQKVIPGYTTYKVKENDTLQKISKKFYGTTKKWPVIYEENKDIIKNPDKIYPGLVIKIPLKD